jgi:hypothetical protein
MEAERLAAFLITDQRAENAPVVGDRRCMRLQLKRGITAHFSSIRSPNHREIFLIRKTGFTNASTRPKSPPSTAT